MWKYSLLALCVGLILQHCFVVNTSSSFPPGVYLKTHKQPQKGDLVLFCPPAEPVFTEALQRGFVSAGLCPSGTGYLIKQYVADAGDSVHIARDSVTVNGKVLAGSQQQINMTHAVQPIMRIVQPQEVLLMSPHPLSFDGRYFGLTSITQIKTPLTPWYLWKE